MSNNTYNLTYKELLENFELKLNQTLVSDDILVEAMRYSCLDGGKRIRPLLVVAAGNISQAKLDNVLTIGVAIELIHCYSLIHDDLPAMDDDNLRRGRLTCHKKYNEAIAILAGDALQCEAFIVLSSEALVVDPVTKLKIIQLIATCSGKNGMVGGQAIDLLSTGMQLDLLQLQQMHSMKTGALIRASVLAGYLAGTNPTDEIFAKLTVVANNLGLLFQIIDDILDATTDTKILGKTANKDLQNDKATYVNLLGLITAKELAKKLYHDNLKMLEVLPQNDQLIELTHIIYKRSN